MRPEAAIQLLAAALRARRMVPRAWPCDDILTARIVDRRFYSEGNAVMVIDLLFDRLNEVSERLLGEVTERWQHLSFPEPANFAGVNRAGFVGGPNS